MTRIADMQMQLDELNKQLEMLNNIDPLTQLLNRRGFAERLEIDLASNKRKKEELSIMLLDIDYFKPYNDNYGHPQGDLCLQQFSQVLTNCMQRPADSVARYGGEEFLIILPATPIYGALLKAEQIIQALSDASILHEHSSVANYITASIGISSTRFGAHDYTELIEQADSALYQAKHQGRNRRVIYQPEVQD
jgi:diguanylate cyclase (GGDEF)-like protein